ncbi:MAG TPA: DUF58 domain-containing protein [Planctomycetota bacterium]|jgi:uncharacterized protein (DUF58 family)|nr:DUF58 domain-containing protein [Planctomycetota bacterium]
MASRTLSREELFDPQFMASILRLRVLARRVARGGRPAEQRSKDLGGGIEFQDYRPYSLGDDFRAIDWNIYRRLGKVFLRLFEEMEDLPVYLAPDISESLFLEDPPRVIATLRTAMALGAIALNQHDSVGLFPFSSDLRVDLRPAGGRSRIHRLAGALAALEPAGRTDFRASFHTLRHRKLRSGLLVVISDFFDPAGIDAVINSLKVMKHRLLLVAITRPEDRVPTISGDLELRDCETGELTEISVTSATIARYTEAYDQHQLQLADFAKSRGTPLLRIDATRDLVPQLAALFEGGTYVP